MEEEKKQRRSILWILVGCAVALTAGGIFMSLYGFFQDQARRHRENPFETAHNINLLYHCNQALYRDLYNANTGENLSYLDLYYPLKEDIRALADKYSYSEDWSEEEWKKEALEVESSIADSFSYSDYLKLNGQRTSMANYFAALDGYFGSLSVLYDYMIQDTVTGKLITNVADVQDIKNGEEYSFLLEFRFDELGNCSIGTVEGEDAGQIRRYAADDSRTLALPSDDGDLAGTYSFDADSILANSEKRYITNCRILYGVKENILKQLETGTLDLTAGISFYHEMTLNAHSYYYAGVGTYYMVFLTVILLLALFLPFVEKGKPWRAFSLCRMPLEGLAVLGIFLYSFLNFEVSSMVSNTMEGNWSNWIQSVFRISYHICESISFLANLVCLAVVFFAAWFLGISLRMIREVGIWSYIKERSLIYRFFPFLRYKVFGKFLAWMRNFYDTLVHFDVTRDAKKTIIKILAANAVLLYLISLMWVGSFFALILYSVILYFILKKYISDLQKKYGILLRATNEIAEGNLNVSIPEDIGVFEPFRPQIYRIQTGFRKAVEEETKSQRMKAELITNVSHDLKTPLTAIITYIDLLKDENITPEQRKEYLDTLERKSLRLKVLIEDLFEVSKATSRAVQLNLVEVDIMNLIKQVRLELSDKLDAARLEVRMNLPEEKVALSLDSQKTYRIYENLFGNIAKYSMEGTRVYVNAAVTPEEVTITLRNISAQEIHVNPAELTERFVRGDISRNTEGSGLGLAIAKSFTELQNGKLLLEVEDDLFKVTTVWKRN